MAKVDFWWDGLEPQRAEGFDALLAAVVKRRPAHSPPVIAVVCNAKRFRGSALHKVARVTGLLQTVDFSDLPDERTGTPGVALLRWSPFDRNPIPGHLRQRIPRGVRVLNDTDLNTDKSNVDAHFRSVAGYGASIESASESGFMVAKSNINGRHDGRVVQFPSEREDPHVVYQRMIDNSLGDYVFDIRVPFVLGQPVLAYVKFRDRWRRFQNANADVRLVTPADVLSDDELAICQNFCRSIGLEYGELDILRDGPDGRIYVIDANNTPAGPPNALSPSDRLTAMRLIAIAFRRNIFNLPC